MRKTFSLALALLLLACLWGCAPKFVTEVNGYPLPKEFDLSWSPDKSLSAQWFFVRWHPQKIESKGFSEYIEQPDYLAPDDTHTLAPDTKAVVINLNVKNPKRQKYRLVKVVKVGGTTREEGVVPWTIREHLNLVVPGPLAPGQDVTMMVKVLSGETDRVDEPLLSTGELHYRVMGPSAASGEDQKGGVAPG
jgi:hypothetical protein